MTVPKAERRRLAKAEVIMHLASTAQRWADDIEGGDARVAPFDQWPADDPHRALCRTYDLAPKDLVAILTKLADGLEDRAERAGYADHWDEAEAS